MRSTDKTSVKEKVLNSIEKIRPYLQADGGDVELMDVSADYVVTIKLNGACHQCPHHLQTTTGVEEAIKREVPEIKTVVTFQA